MAKIAVYPLMDVLEVKQRRVEEAEKIVQEKLKLLNQEKEVLTKKEADRDQVKTHKSAKLDQLRDELDHGTTCPKVLQMKAYLKVVDEKLAAEEKKVSDQQVKVDQANKEWEKAREDVRIKRQEVDKLQMHRTDWEKEARKEREIVEGREMDELGEVIYTSNRRKSEMNSLKSDSKGD